VARQSVSGNGTSSNFLAFAEDTYDELVGPIRPEIRDLRERERDNLRAALRFALERADATRTLRLADF
jgi:hypothetical protein